MTKQSNHKTIKSQNNQMTKQSNHKTIKSQNNQVKKTISKKVEICYFSPLYVDSTISFMSSTSSKSSIIYIAFAPA